MSMPEPEFTEAEMSMSLFEFIDHAAAQDGLDQSVADEYKRAFNVALDLGQEPDDLEPSA